MFVLPINYTCASDIEIYIVCLILKLYRLSDIEIYNKSSLSDIGSFLLHSEEAAPQHDTRGDLGRGGNQDDRCPLEQRQGADV